MVMYRTNAYEPEPMWQPSSLDRLSYRLVGHYCLFTNIATISMVVIPLWSGVILVVYLACKLISLFM